MQHVSNNRRFFLRAALTTALAVSPLLAQTSSGSGGLLNVTPGSRVVSNSQHTAHTEGAAVTTTTNQFWTADRIQSAKPYVADMRAGADGLPMVSDTPAAFGAAASTKAEGGLPSVEIGGSLQKSLAPALSPAEVNAKATELAAEQAQDVPQSTSPFGGPFTTSRVFPDASATAYPYRTAGKLFF